MVYLLYGIKDFSIDEKIKKLVSGFLDVNRFDLNIHSINDVIDDLEFLLPASKNLEEIIGNILDINKLENNQIQQLQHQFICFY